MISLSPKGFDYVRNKLFQTKLTQSQVDGINAKLVAINKYGITDIQQAAYILATAYHETSREMEPVEEVGKGRGRPYGKHIDQDGSMYHVDQLYYGRGDVQLTWYSNYVKFSRILKVDLVNHPELALQPDISAAVLVIGMRDGMFTGKKLSDFIHDQWANYIQARRIINLLDCAGLIANYAVEWEKALRS